MRVLVDSVPLSDTALSFERGNQDAARFHHVLADRLARFGAMAGDASLAEEFAAAYDDAARSCLAAVADLVDAFATCGRLTLASLANHGRAEARSVISGRTVFDGSACVAGYVAVLPCAPPSSLGGDLSGLPGWASWILDQVEGFVWPDADVDRLREAAACWRSASFQIADLSSYCDSAVRGFLAQRSPEVPIAVEVTERLARSCVSVADQCAVLAKACSDYADHVEEQRAAILDLVHDLIRDAVIIQGIGIVLGAVTVGTTAAAATALNAAKIAAAAPRFMRIIALLRSLASTCAAPMRLAASALRDLRLELAVFRNARSTVASAYDAERLARVARLREVVHNLRLFDPKDLRGLSSEQVAKILTGLAGPRIHDRRRLGLQVPVQQGPPDRSHGRLPHRQPTRPDHGRALRCRLAGQRRHQDPARREPNAVKVIDELLMNLEETLEAEGTLSPLLVLLVVARG